MRIRDDRIDEFARRLALEPMLPPRLDVEHHFVGTPDETARFFLTLDSINFGSGYFPYLVKRPGMSGYFTIASSLADRFRTRGPLTTAELESITPARCAMLFGQDPGNAVVAELMDLFARALRGLGQWLERRFNGSALQAVASAQGSAARLVELACEMPMFWDEAEYDGLPVAFYKRAQILASDLALAFGNLAPGSFDDLHRLTIFADNLVPHVLRLDGLLEYDDNLAAAIDAGAPIAAGTPEEIELRACAVDAVERLVAKLDLLGLRTTARDLDVALWNRGQTPAYKKAKPRHRTRTIFY